MQIATQKKFRQVLQITLIWVLVGIYIRLYNNIEFDHATGGFIYQLPNGINFGRDLWSSTLPPLLGGLLGGSLIIFWLKDRVKEYSYGRMLIIHSLIYLGIILLLSFITLTINDLLYGSHSLTKSLLTKNLRIIFTNPGFWKPLSFWYIIVMLTVFFLQVNEKYGQGVLWNFLSGKYHRPREEYRIFMFLDIKSSTTIAEQIGSSLYYQMIRQFFTDITNPVINTRGEIYQYVGDEVIITWKTRKSLDGYQAIRCYEEIRQHIQHKEAWYIHHFGHCPTFKAGIHAGMVTVGEIGVIKKDLTYTGDVLNTASRIMGCCKEFGCDLLFSEELISKMEKPVIPFRFMAEVSLRGKQAPVRLFTI